jgi:hypothetical protein
MDSSSGALEGAMVTAREIATNITGSAKTDRDGRFRFPYLRVGRYDLTVHMDGFVDATRRLTLTLGAAFDVTPRAGSP